MAENDTLTPVQRRAINALLSERNTRDAAKAAKVSERSLWRWLTDTDFRAELTRQEGAVIDQATRSLLAMQGAALEVFDKVLTNGTATDANRLRAAEGVLDYLLKLRELNTLEQRIAKLEEAQNVKAR
jgi:hypothetical protein